MGVLEDAAEIASNLGKVVSPSSYEMPWGRFPKGIMSADYILNGIGPAFQEASAVYQTLDLPDMDPSKAASAWKVFADETLRIKDALKDSKTAGILAAIPVIGPMVLLPAALSYKVATNVLGGLIAALFFTSAQGALGHIALKDASTQQFSIHKMVIDGDLPEATAVSHAGWCYTGFRLITILNGLGALRPLKKGGTSGLGALPIVPLVIGAVAVVCIIAGAIVLSKNLSEVNVLQAKVVETKLQAMKDACEKTSDPKIIAQCARGPTKDDLMGGSLASGISEAIAKVGSDLAKYLVIAGAIYLGAMMLPTLLGKAKEAKDVVTA
jgi:hypothetical protein